MQGEQEEERQVTANSICVGEKLKRMRGRNRSLGIAGVNQACRGGGALAFQVTNGRRVQVGASSTGSWAAGISKTMVWSHRQSATPALDQRTCR